MEPFILNPTSGPLSINCIRVFATEFMPTDTVEDWSQVRAPSRAARRRRHGHRQRIVYRQEPRRELLWVEAQNAMFMHPIVLDEFKVALERRAGTDEFWEIVRKALLDVGLNRAAATIRTRRAS